MSRNGSGVYSVPNTFVAGTTITASDHNENWDDIEAEITNSLALDGQSTMTGVLKLSAGTAAAPSAAFGSDLDTGVYRRDANTLGFATGGAAAGYFDSAQKFFALGAADVAGAVNLQSTLAVAGASTLTGAVTLVGALTGAAATLSGLLTLSSTSHFIPPSGTTAQRPGSPVESYSRFNTTTHALEYYDGTSWVSPMTSASASTQAEMEAASSLTTFASPGRTQYHPGVAKAWGFITVSGGTPTATVSHNVTSITDNGVGDYTINFTTPFSSANFAIVAMMFDSAGNSASGIIFTVECSAKTSSTARINIWKAASSGSTNQAVVDASFFFVAFGDQ